MASFDERFEELWTLAYRVAYRVGGDRELARDIAQEAAFRVARRWSRAEAHAPALTAKIAGDLAIDAWRRNRRRMSPSTGEAPQTGIAIEERSELVDALRRLPARQRQTVVLRYVADLSEADTAAALGCSEGTVKTHASRALASLRKILTAVEPGG